MFDTVLRILALYHTWHTNSLVRCAGSGPSSLIDLLLDDRILLLHGILG